MKILRTCQLCMSYSGLSTEELVNIGEKYLPRAIIQTIIVCSLILLISTHITNIIKNYVHGLQAILFAMHSLVSVVIKLITLIVLMFKISKIVDLIEYMENVATQRTFHFHFGYIFSSVNFFSYHSWASTSRIQI